VRFPREVTRIDNIALNKLPKKPVFDEGSYTVTKSDSRAAAEQKMSEGINKSSFGFILNGKKLKGRFLLKTNGTRTVLQKYKDKYATEEDVLSQDLARTVHTMLPDYDEKKVELPHREKSSKRPVKKEEEPAPEITEDKNIGAAKYHFTFYTSDTGDVICLITDAGGAVIVLQLNGKRWKLLSPAGKSALKHEQELTGHASALYKKNRS
jgi:hypothetical protein